MLLENFTPKTDKKIKNWASNKAQSSFDLSKKLPWKSEEETLALMIQEKKQKLKDEINKTTQVETEEDKKWKIADWTIAKEKTFQNTETQRINQKIQKIKSVLPPNSDIAQQLQNIDSKTEQEKQTIFTQILNTLKSPWKLKAITDQLGWADKNNPKYQEFKNTLIGLDSSFEQHFENLEIINLATNEVVDSIEKESWWLVNIDLKSDSPISKMSLIWSSYSFDKKIDKKALSELMSESQNKIDVTQRGFASLKGFIKPFDSLLTQISGHWKKENFQENLKGAVNNFGGDIFDELDDVYKKLDIKSDEQITESDIINLANTHPPENLEFKIESIKKKLLNLKAKIEDVQAWIIKQYKIDLKELITREDEQKERELKVLEFLNASGFDLLPKKMTDKIITMLQNGSLTIPWLELDKENIDLKNGNFWESNWLNDISKTNIVKFVNKMISWDVNEPLSVDGIASWTLRADKEELMSKSIEAGIVDNLGWKFGKILENLRKNNLLN